ncbi:lysozyme [Sphingomonas sp.]|uniref:lysozyme n=1 Tax=Sphingomonas sp. TaxID=28214 RepID=UPI003D6D0D80
MTSSDNGAKRLFDAIRRIKGKALSDADVRSVNAALTGAAHPAPSAASVPVPPPLAPPPLVPPPLVPPPLVPPPPVPSVPAPSTLAPSRRCADFIKGFEQCRLTAYLPTPDDVPTIGWGTTGPGIRLGLVWTQAQADTAFAADLDQFGGRVAALLGTAATTEAQYDAMVSLAYNIGTTAFANSTLLRLHRAGDHAGAAEQFARWNKQAGTVLNGLTRRRAAERALYLGAGEADGGRAA